MRIVLVATNVETDPYPVYPLGMSIVARALTRAGHEVHQFDWLTVDSPEQALAGMMQEIAPGCVGISIRNVDNVDSLSPDQHWGLGAVRDLVQTLHARHAVPVVLGGPGFSIMPDTILEFTGADYGVVGEGEASMCELVEALERGRRPQRLSTSEKLGRSGQLSAALDTDMAARYLAQGGVMGVQTKRGCPNACAYCTYPNLEGHRIRPREVGAVVEDLERLHRDHGVHEIFFTDSVFNDRDGNYLELVEELVRRNNPVAFSAYFQPGHTSPSEMALLKRAGLKAIELGTDAACDQTLRGLCKGFRFDQAEAFSRMCVDLEVPCAHFVIFGGPGETMDTVEQGLKNLDRLEHCVVFAFLGIRMHPGTPLQRRALAEGVITKEDSLLEPKFYYSADIEPGAVQARLTEAFMGHRDRFFPPSKASSHMEVLRRFGYTGILWDTLIRFPGAVRQPAARLVSHG